MGLLLAANNQATRRNQIIRSQLPPGLSSNGYAPRLPQQRTKSSTKQLAPTDPILGPENLLKTGFAQKGLPSTWNFPRHYQQTQTRPECEDTGVSLGSLSRTKKNEKQGGCSEHTVKHWIGKHLSMYASRARWAFEGVKYFNLLSIFPNEHRLVAHCFERDRQRDHPTVNTAKSQLSAIIGVLDYPVGCFSITERE